MKEGIIMLKRIRFWFLRMLFFALVCFYSVFITCKEGNYLNLDVIIALLILINLSLALACQSLYYFLLLLEKNK